MIYAYDRYIRLGVDTSLETFDAGSGTFRSRIWGVNRVDIEEPPETQSVVAFGGTIIPAKDPRVTIEIVFMPQYIETTPQTNGHDEMTEADIIELQQYRRDAATGSLWLMDCNLPRQTEFYCGTGSVTNLYSMDSPLAVTVKDIKKTFHQGNASVKSYTDVSIILEAQELIYG